MLCLHCEPKCLIAESRQNLCGDGSSQQRACEGSSGRERVALQQKGRGTARQVR